MTKMDGIVVCLRCQCIIAPVLLLQPNYTAVAETCNTFRVYGDIYDSFQSIRSITGWYGDNEGDFASVAGPGNWNDPDEVIQVFGKLVILATSVASSDGTPEPGCNLFKCH